MSEAGVPGYHFTNWWGLLAPAGTDPKIVERLSAEVQKIAAMPEVRERLVGAGITAGGSTPQAFAQSIREENGKIARIIDVAAIKFE